MGLTKIDSLKAPQARVTLGVSLPSTPSSFYGSASNDVDSVEWRGGEMFYHTTENRFYIQTATSGTTATWKRLLEQTVAA